MMRNVLNLQRSKTQCVHIESAYELGEVGVKPEHFESLERRRATLRTDHLSQCLASRADLPVIR